MILDLQMRKLRLSAIDRFANQLCSSWLRSWDLNPRLAPSKAWAGLLCHLKVLEEGTVLTPIVTENTNPQRGPCLTP